MINKSLLHLWHHIDNRRKKSLLALLCLLICASFAEVVTIGAIIPFLSVLADPVGLYANPNVASIANNFGITDHDELILPIVIFFGLAALISGIIRLALLYFSNKITFAIGHDLSVNMYRKTCTNHMPHIEKNSSEVINAVSVKSTLVIFGIVMPILVLFNSAIMLTVVFLLIAVDPLVL